MGDVFIDKVLLFKSVRHFFGDISCVFAELINSIAFNPFNFLPLSGKFAVQNANNFALHLSALGLLKNDSIFDLFGVACKIFENRPLIGNSVASFLVEISSVDFNLSVYRS